MDALAALHLLRPQWLLLLLPLALLLWWQRRQRAAAGRWRDVVDPELLPFLLLETGQTRTPRRRVGPWLTALAGLLAILALSGPSWQRLPQPVLQREDALVLVLDLSYSMWAQDSQPSRLERARRKLLDLLERRSEGQTALVAYAGDAHVVTPLTDDHPTIANLLPALQPDIMPVPGSDPAAAIEQALGLLRSAGILSGQILLLTDGLEDEDARAIAALLEGRDVRLSILGIGTPQGAPISLPGGGFLKDDAGAIVTPRLPEGRLRNLAAEAGGAYRGLAVDDSDINALLVDADSLAGATRELSRRADQWQDMGHWFALPLLALALFAFRRGSVYSALPLLFVLSAADSRAGVWEDLWLTPDQQGAKALDAGDPETAAARFEDPSWRGTAAYQAEDWSSAAKHFSSEDTADAWYNRGNALARQGELEAAAEAYRRSLELEPGQADAEENLALVEDAMAQQQSEDAGDSENGDSDEGEEQQNASNSDDGQDRDRGQETGSKPDEASENDGSAREPGDPAGDQGAREPGADPAADEAAEERAERERESVPTGPSTETPTAEPDNLSQLAESLEREQAMQQWLRRVPDDPSGLLREKFRYESRKRQRQGEETPRDGKIW
jgi:Ca-activated chloride channel family protein